MHQPFQETSVCCKYLSNSFQCRLLILPLQTTKIGSEGFRHLLQVTQLGSGQEAGSSGADGTLAGQHSEGSQEHTEESVAHIFKNTKRIRLFLGLKLTSILSCSQDAARGPGLAAVGPGPRHPSSPAARALDASLGRRGWPRVLRRHRVLNSSQAPRVTPVPSLP